MEGWIIWLAIAALLVIVEVLSQMVWTLCLAVGCAAGLVMAVLGFGVALQIAAMAVVSVLAFLLGMPLFRKWHAASMEKEPRDDRTGMDALLGRRATVTEPIRPDHLGRVRIDGDNWQACAPGEVGDIERGEEVVVYAYDSIVLKVQRLK